MKGKMDTLDVVDLVEILPEHNVHRGQVGTVVAALDSDVFEVEFSDAEGRAYASLALTSRQLLVLYYERVEANSWSLRSRGRARV
jgi:hypothetical protein